jgi:CHASE2 domain-containing sensor protein
MRFPDQGSWIKAWEDVRDWLRARPTWRDVLIGVLFGGLIEFVAVPFYFHDLSIVRHVGDDTVDRMIRLDQRLTGLVSNAMPFVFIDIDDASWAEWKFPLITPRDKIAELIDHAAASKPALIFLDIDLSWPSNDARGDGTLTKLIKGYGDNKPPLLLIRPLVESRSANPEPLPRTRNTVLEADASSVPEKARSNFSKAVKWVSSEFEKDDDGSVRRWRLYEIVCDPVGLPAVLPSLQLSAALQVLLHGDELKIASALKAADVQIPAGCSAPPRSTEPVTFQDAAPPIASGLDDFGDRIIYTIGWDHAAATLGPQIEQSGGPILPLVAVRPARAVLKLPAGQPIEGLKDRIVVIGGSYAGSGDWHKTPIGPMPGALIAINAMHNLIEFGTPREPKEPLRTGIALALVVVVALLFSWLRPFVAGFAATIVTLIILIVSIPWFRSGVILDLAVPSFGVVVHNLLLLGIDTSKNLWRHGWRWLKRPID